MNSKGYSYTHRCIYIFITYSGTSSSFLCWIPRNVWFYSSWKYYVRQTVMCSKHLLFSYVYIFMAYSRAMFHKNSYQWYIASHCKPTISQLKAIISVACITYSYWEFFFCHKPRNHLARHFFVLKCCIFCTYVAKDMCKCEIFMTRQKK